MDTIETYVERHHLRDVLSDELIGTLRLVVKEPGELIVRAGGLLQALRCDRRGRDFLFGRLRAQRH